MWSSSPPEKIIVPPDHTNAPVVDRLAGRRRIRFGLSLHRAEVDERFAELDADFIFGSSGDGVIAIPDWTGPDLTLISRGRWLALAPGMKLHACHDEGEDRMPGTYEELTAAGVAFPLFINVSKLNIRVREGLVMLMQYQAI